MREGPRSYSRCNLSQIYTPRFPVVDGDLDRVLGFVHIKDLLANAIKGQPIDLKSFSSPAPRRVPEMNDGSKCAGNL